MPTDVIMPALGMAQETGKVVRWHKAEGDAVAMGDPLLEIETDKVTVDIEAPADGTLAGIRAPDGAERSEEHTPELQSRQYLVCRPLLEKNNKSIVFCSHALTSGISDATRCRRCHL